MDPVNRRGVGMDRSRMLDDMLARSLRVMHIVLNIERSGGSHNTQTCDRKPKGKNTRQLHSRKIPLTMVCVPHVCLRAALLRDQLCYSMRPERSM